MELGRIRLGLDPDDGVEPAGGDEAQVRGRVKALRVGRLAPRLGPRHAEAVLGGAPAQGPGAGQADQLEPAVGPGLDGRRVRPELGDPGEIGVPAHGDGGD